MRSNLSCGYGKSFDPLQTTVGHPTFGHRLGFVWPMDSGNAAEYIVFLVFTRHLLGVLRDDTECWHV